MYIRMGEWVIKPSQESRPRKVMVELTMKCNYNCLYCFRRGLVGEELVEMEPEVMRRVLSESAEAGVEWIVLSGWGEPLLHPMFLDFISEAKKLGLRILVNTNGSLLPDYADDLYRIRVDNVTVSIDAPENKSYGELRRGGSLENVRTGLERLRELKIRDSRRIPEINVAFTLTRLNCEYIVSTARIAYKLGASRMIVSNVVPISPEVERELACYMDEKCIEDVEKAKLELARLGLEVGIEVDMPRMTVACSERSCPFMRERALFIRSDGMIAPCMYYSHHWRNTLMGITREIKPLLYGSIWFQRLLEAWLREDYVSFRATTFFMMQPSCLDCPLQEYCTLTLTNEADCWGNTPTCAHCPYSRDMARCML